MEMYKILTIEKFGLQFNVPKTSWEDLEMKETLLCINILILKKKISSVADVYNMLYRFRKNVSIKLDM